MKTLFDVTPYTHTHVPGQIRDLPICERPLYRLHHVGPRAVSPAELIAAIWQTSDGLARAHQLLKLVDGQLHQLPHLTRHQLTQLWGIGDAQAGRLQAALELGRRVLMTPPDEPTRITAPGDAANLLMYEMMDLKQEHLRLILLDTRNQVLATPTIYIGSLNTSVVRVGELFKPAITHHAAALIVLHNHPSGDPSPSPEDIRVTRQLVKAGELLDLEVLDHIIIGRLKWVSLKERRLGFD